MILLSLIIACFTETNSPDTIPNQQCLSMLKLDNLKDLEEHPLDPYVYINWDYDNNPYSKTAIIEIFYLSNPEDPNSTVLNCQSVKMPLTVFGERYSDTPGMYMENTRWGNYFGPRGYGSLQLTNRTDRIKKCMNKLYSMTEKYNEVTASECVNQHRWWVDSKLGLICTDISWHRKFNVNLRDPSLSRALKPKQCWSFR